MITYRSFKKLSVMFFFNDSIYMTDMTDMTDNLINIYIFLYIYPPEKTDHIGIDQSASFFDIEKPTEKRRAT